MNKASSRPKLRLLISFLGLMTAACMLLWSGGQHPSWAAPGQSPWQQTIPSRDDTPTPPPPTPEPTLEIPVSNEAEGDGGEAEDEATSPLQPGDGSQVETPPEGIQPEPERSPLSPSQPVETEDNPNPPVQSPGGEAVEGQKPAEPAVEQAKDGPEGNQPGEIPSQADLQLIQTVSNITPHLGEVVTFTLTLSNEGPHSATQAGVSALLPPQFALKSMMAGQGSYQIGWGRWTVDMLPANQSVTLNLVAKVIGTGILTHTAEIIAVDQPDPDSIPGNALVHEDDQAAVSLLIASGSAPVNAEIDTVSPAAGELLPSSAPPFSRNIPLLFWLYALILGVILLMGGLLLVRYS